MFLASDLSKDVTGQIFAVRKDEIFLMSQPRPLRVAHKDGGWTPQIPRRDHAARLQERLLPARPLARRVQLGAAVHGVCPRHRPGYHGGGSRCKTAPMTDRNPRPAARQMPDLQPPTDAKYRPFCSRRCADVDLSRWLGGAYAIPDAAESEDGDEEHGEHAAVLCAGADKDGPGSTH